MKKSLLLSAACLLLTSVSLAGQTSTETKSSPAGKSGVVDPDQKGVPPPALTAVEKEWNDITMLATPLPPMPGATGPNSDAAARTQQKQVMMQRFQAAAEKARAFQTAYPDHPKAAEARQLETKSLLNAAMYGDNSQEARIRDLVEEVRKDKRLSVKVRYQAVALADIVRIRPYGRERERFLAAHEKAARDQIVEFGTEAGPYESLLRLAETNPDEAKGISLAREILTMPAPDSVKSAAQTMLARQSLVGRPLGELVRPALGSKIPLPESKPVVLYTWATWSKGSLAYAKDLAKRVPAGTTLVGLNLDKDPEAARQAAAAEALPGEQIYDERGMESPLAQALKVYIAPQVYVSDSSGIIRETAAQRGNLAAKLAALR